MKRVVFAVSLVVALWLVALSTYAQPTTPGVPPRGPTGISTVLPTSSAEIVTVCGQIPPTSPGRATAAVINAQSRAQVAYAAGRFEDAARDYWIAFALQPVVGRLEELAPALVGLDGPVQPVLCAVLVCLRSRAANEVAMNAIVLRERTANCGQPATPVAPVAPAVAPVQTRLVTGPITSPVVNPPVTPPPHRSTLAWGVSIGGWATGLVGLSMVGASLFLCENGNAFLRRINSGEVANWSPTIDAMTRNNCARAWVGLGIALTGTAIGTTAFLLTRPAPAPPRVTVGLAPQLSPNGAGLTVFGSF